MSILHNHTRKLQIDGLRGIATIIVVLFHYFNNSYSNNFELNLFERVISKITSFGWSGVNLFFVISGYLIGTILLKNKNSTNYFSTFYARRFLRIVPLYFIFLIVFIFFNSLFKDSSLILFEKPIPVWQYFLFVQNFSMSHLGHFGPNALTPSWSLAIEEQFYLIAPIMVFFLRKKNVLLIVTLCLIVFSIFFRINSDNWYMEYTHFLSRVDSLSIGLIIAIFSLNSNEMVVLSKKRNLIIFIIIFTCLLFGYAICKQINHTFISYFFGGVLVFSFRLKDDTFLYKILVNKVTLFLGKHSFFIYLFHQLINGLLFAYIFNSNPVLNTTNNYLVEILAVLLTMFLAVISFKFYESKFIAIGQSLTYD